jgi:hypothetical protein
MEESHPLNKKAKELLGSRSLIFRLSQGQASRFDPDAFRAFVELAVEFGATHVQVGNLPFRYDSWVLPDNRDPYASWCNAAPSLLRVCPPEELHDWIPADQAKAVQQFIEAQLEIIRPFGLKGVLEAVEPMWLPEGVYRAHPRWRGAQCELGRIAARPYFAPSIDEPEVLDLYRRAARRFGEMFPEIDQMGFLSNDSGAGISWSPCLYPGMNGPVRWRRREGGSRIANWLKAIQDGAAESGVKLRLNIYSSGFPPELTESAQQKAAPGTFVCWGNRHGESWGVGGAGMAAGLWSTAYPVLGLGDPVSFVAGLQGVYSNPRNDSGRADVSVGEADMGLARILLECCMENPGPGLIERCHALLSAAERMCGREHAETLIHAWENVSSAQRVIQQVRQKGFGLAIPFCCVSMRWLTRPLVPEPEKLTPDETAHYRKFLFATEADKQIASFSNVLGKQVFRGESVMWMTRWCLTDAIGVLRGAAGNLDNVAKQIKDADAARRVSLYAVRVRALACLAANVRHTVMYQYALHIAHQPQFGPNAMDYDDNIIYDHRALNMRKIAREELDNITELIELIESQPEKVLEYAACPEEESVFLLGPDLVADLKRKMAIMLDHWQDYERLYPSTKVYDFEPEPRGNIVPPDTGGPKGL